MSNYPYGIIFILEFEHGYTQEVETGTVAPCGLGFDLHQWCDLSQEQQDREIAKYSEEWAKTRYEIRWHVRDEIEYRTELIRRMSPEDPDE